MPTYSTTTFILLASCTLLPTHSPAADTPPPAQQTRFALPLADRTTAEAIILPGPNSQALLVYATPSGKIGLWLIGPTEPHPAPTPTPPPTPNPTPTPPTPTKPTRLIVVGDTERPAIPATIAATAAAHQLATTTLATTQVADEGTTADALDWIGKTAGKQYPWTFLADDSGATQWQGPLDQTTAALARYFPNAPATHSRRPCPCDGGNCRNPQPPTRPTQCNEH